MEKILKNLQILLQDMIKSSEVRRTKQDILVSSDQPLTLLDVKKSVSEQFNVLQESEENKADFTNENVALIFSTRAIFYFFTKAIQVKDRDFLADTIESQKASILDAIQYIHHNQLLNENIDQEREFFEQNKQYGNKPQACYTLMEGNMPKEHFEYALGFYINICSSHFSVEKHKLKEIVYWHHHFKSLFSYVNNAEDLNKFDILTNETLLKYFYIFCDLQTMNKKFMYTELPFMERRIAQNDYTHEVLPCIDIHELYEMLCIDSIIRPDTKQYLVEELVAKVFFNKYSIAKSLDEHRAQVDVINSLKYFEGQTRPMKFAGFKRDDYYTTPSQLFEKIIYLFKEEISDNYGILACLYMLSKEMDIDEFASLFMEEKEESFTLRKHYLKLIDNALKFEAQKNAELDSKNWQGKEYRRYYNIFGGYKDRIKKARTAEILRIQKQQQDIDLGLDNSTSLKKDLLQYFLWFVIFDKIGLYYDNDENIYQPHSEREKMSIPFCNATMDQEYKDINKVNKWFNDLLKKIGVENEVNLSLDKVKDYWSVILLAYNLSRIEPASKDAIVNELNYIREQQKSLLHIDIKDISKKEKDQNKIDEIRKYNDDSRMNHEKLRKIDCGFKIETFAQKFYPFTSSSFVKEGTQNPKDFFIHGFERSIQCKCLWETDNEYFDDGSLDWVKINSKGLKTRYLYRDRNAYSHHTKFANVKALLEPSNWKNLLIALSEFHLLLNTDLWAERVGFRLNSPVDSSIQNDDVFFQNIYLQNEAENLFDTLILYVQEKYKCAPRIFKILDSQKYNETRCNGGDWKKECLPIYKCIEYIENNKTNKNPDIDYSQCKGLDDENGTFVIRLEKMLNIMFLVNDTYVSDVQSVKFMDFYSQYNMEISLYLIYMTFALNYCDEVKIE